MVINNLRKAVEFYRQQLDSIEPTANSVEPTTYTEQLLFDTLQTNKHLWVKKATGLGVTEFMLRYMSWLCLKDDTYRNSQMCIVTGPREDLAIGLIDRMKKLFLALGITFDTRDTMIELNGVRIDSYPSNHLDATVEHNTVYRGNSSRQMNTDDHV